LIFLHCQISLLFYFTRGDFIALCGGGESIVVRVEDSEVEVSKVEEDSVLVVVVVVGEWGT